MARLAATARQMPTPIAIISTTTAVVVAFAAVRVAVA